MDQNCQENCLYCSQTMAHSSINRDCRIYHQNQVPGLISIAEDTYIRTIMRCKGLRMENQNLQIKIIRKLRNCHRTQGFWESIQEHLRTPDVMEYLQNSLQTLINTTERSRNMAQKAINFILAYKASEDRFEIENEVIF